MLPLSFVCCLQHTLSFFTITSGWTAAGASWRAGRLYSSWVNPEVVQYSVTIINTMVVHVLLVQAAPLCVAVCGHHCLKHWEARGAKGKAREALCTELEFMRILGASQACCQHRFKMCLAWLRLRASATYSRTPCPCCPCLGWSFQPDKPAKL